MTWNDNKTWMPVELAIFMLWTIDDALWGRSERVTLGRPRLAVLFLYLHCLSRPGLE